MRTLEQDKKAVAQSLKKMDGFNTVEKFAIGQIVKIYHGASQGTVVKILPLTLLIKRKNGSLQRILKKNVSIQKGENMYGEGGEFAWVEALFAAQKRYYKPGSMEAAIKAN